MQRSLVGSEMCIRDRNGITPDETVPFVGTLIQMQWIRRLNLYGEYVMVMIAKNLTLPRFLSYNTCPRLQSHARLLRTHIHCMTHYLCSHCSAITSAVAYGSPFLIIKYKIAKSHLSTTQLCCLNEPDNGIRAAGATALVEALKETKNLQELNLRCEFWMVGIARSLTVMRYTVNM